MSKRTLPIGIICGALVIALVLLGCGNPLGSGSGPGTRTLAQQVVDELGQNLAGSIGKSFAPTRSVYARSLTQSDVDALKAAALSQITSDGYAQSTALDKILPAMISGVMRGLGSIASSTLDLQATVLTLTTKSAMGSLGPTARQSNFTNGVTVDAAVRAVAETAARAIVVSIVNPTTREAALAAAVCEAAKAIDAAEGIDASTAEKALLCLVEGSVEAALTGGSGSAELVKTISAELADTVNDLTKPSDTAGLIQSVVEAAVQTVAENPGPVPADETIKLAVAAVESLDGVTLSASDIEAAAGGMVTGEISAVLAEVAPSITSASASPSTLSAAGTVTLAVNATGVSYEWVCAQPSGLVTVVPCSQVDGSATFAVDSPGTYTFAVTVKNLGGYKETVKADMVVTATFQLASVQQAINDGIRALKINDYDGALTNFTRAAALDNTDPAALFWKAFMDLACVSVDPDIVSLMRDRIGLTDYPSSMNTLLSTTWFNGNWYSTSYAFYVVTDPSPSGHYYIRGNFTPMDDTYPSFIVHSSPNSFTNTPGYFALSETGDKWVDGFFDDAKAWHNASEYTSATKYAMGNVVDLAIPILLPELDVPEWGSSLIGKFVQGEDASHLSVMTFPIVLALNIVEHNPNGFDSVVDSVLSGAFGARFNAAMSEIAAVPADAEVTIPNDLFSAYGMTRPPSAVIKINKPELTAAAASLQLLKSFVQVLSSYKLSYPVSSVKLSFWDSTDGNSNGVPDWADTLLTSAPNPISQGVFGTRNAGARDTAKATMKTALMSLHDAITTFLGKSDADMQTYFSNVKGTDVTPEDVTKVKNVLNGARNSADALYSALDSGTLYVDSEAMSTGTVWTDSIYTWPSSVSTDTTLQIVPSKLYSDDVFNPAKLFVVTKDGSNNPIGLQLYGYNSASSTRTILNAKDTTNLYTEAQVAMDWNARVTQFFVPSTSMNMHIEDGKLYLSLPFGGGGSPHTFTDADWQMFNWLMGK